MNNISIVGRLARDPEARTTQAGGTICRFCVAVDKRTKDGESAADFLDVVAFNKTAEFVCAYFAKGKRIGVEGSLHSHTWDGDDGKKHKAVDIAARQVYFVDNKGESGGAPAPRGTTAPASRPAARNNSTGFDDFEMIEDEVPF